MTVSKEWSRVVGRVVAGLLLSLAGTAATALTLGEAKEQGLLGETNGGYVASPGATASGEVRALADQINKARREAYARSATEAGVSRDVIEARMAQRLFDRADSGDYVQDAQGAWIRKP